jgi:hypothetical protein
MPFSISNAVDKHNHNKLRLRLSSLRLRLSASLRLRLSSAYGYAYRAVGFALFGGLTVMLMAAGVALGVILLAVLMSW